jgi:hypothetical protein
VDGGVGVGSARGVGVASLETCVGVATGNVVAARDGVATWDGVATGGDVGRGAVGVAMTGGEVGTSAGFGVGMDEVGVGVDAASALAGMPTATRAVRRVEYTQVRMRG